MPTERYLAHSVVRMCLAHRQQQAMCPYLMRVHIAGRSPNAESLVHEVDLAVELQSCCGILS